MTKLLGYISFLILFFLSVYSLECSGNNKVMTVDVIAACANCTLADLSFQFIYNDIIMVFERDIYIGADYYAEFDYCVPSGSYIWRIKSEIGTWPEGSFVSLVYDKEYIIENRLINENQLDIQIAFPFTITKHNKWYYNDGSLVVDENWLQKDFDLNTFQYGSPTMLTNTITRYYIKDFYVSDVFALRALKVGVRCYGGYVLYINGIEVRRHYLEENALSTTFGEAHEMDQYYVISVYPYLITQSGKNYIQIEHHISSNMYTHEVTNEFDAFLHLLSFERFSVINEAYVSLSNMDEHKLDMLDWNRNTFETLVDSTTSFLITFGKERREYFNIFYFEASTNANLDISISVYLYGNNKNTEHLLAYKDITISPSFSSYYISVYSNRESFETIKFIIMKPTNVLIYVYEVDIFNSYSYSSRFNTQMFPTELHYPMATVEIVKDYQDIYIEPSSSGYVNYSYISESPLPDGVHFNTLSGVFSSKDLTESISITRITVFAYDIYAKMHNTTFTLRYESCVYPNFPVYTTFYSGKNGYRENYQLVKVTTSGVRYILFNSTFNEDFTTVRNALCITSSSFSIFANNIYNDLYDDNVEKVWGKTSYIRFDSVDEVPIYYFNQYTAGTKELLVHITSSITSATFFKYYFTNTTLKDWYSSSLDDSSWPSALSSYFPSIIPYPKEHILYYRYTYSFSSLQDLVGVNFRLYMQHGIQFYINDKEYYNDRLVKDENGNIRTTTAFSAPVYQNINVAMSNFILGLNYFVVALYIGWDINIMYSFSLNMFIQKGDCGIRSVNVDLYTNSLNNIYVPENLIDHLWSTKYQTSNSMSDTIDIIYDFQGRREFFNKYTLISANDNAANDPYSWTIYGSFDGYSWTYLSNVKKNIFADRNIGNTYFIYNTHTSYSYIKFSFDITDNMPIQLAELTLYSCQYPSSLSLVYPESQYTIIKGVNFEGAEPTLDYFHEFTVTPTLPRGLQLDTANGRIFGIPEILSASYSIYVIQAKDITNQAHSASIYISVIDCRLPNYLLTINLSVDGDGNNVGFTLAYEDDKDSSITTLLLKKEQLPSYHVSSFGVCHLAGSFKLTLYDYNGSGWQQNTYISVVHQSLITILTERMNILGGISRDFVFNTNYYISPHTDVKLLTGSKEYPTSWLDIYYTDSKWLSITSGTTITVSTITSYIRKSFMLYSLSAYYVYMLYVKTNFGFIAYMNGNEIFRYELPLYGVTMATTSTATSTKWVKISHTAQFDSLNLNTNVIAIEIHAPSTTLSLFDFDMYMLLPENPNTSVLITNGACFTNGDAVSSVYDIRNMFDNSMYTSFYSQTWNFDTSYIIHDFGKESIIYFNQYTFQFGKENYYRFPASWVLQGSVDEFAWTDIDVRTNILVNSNYYKNTFEVNNMKSYRYIRLFVKATQSGTSIPEMEIVDLQFSIHKISIYCSALRSYPSVPGGVYSYTSCSSGYSGQLRAYCNPLTGVFSYFDSSNCTLNSPSDLVYPKSEYIFNMGSVIDSISPSYNGYSELFVISTTLPEGLYFNSINGTIYGTPTRIEDKTLYTIYSENASGKSNTIIISIQIIYPVCRGEDGWDTTKIFYSTIRTCSNDASAYQARTCLYLDNTPVWSVITGDCKQTNTISASIFVAIIVIILIISVILCIYICIRYKKSKKKRLRQVHHSRTSNGSTKTLKI